ncbi:MAG: LapA family protein [Planctomycetota bacterium]|nr:LapA family protein [Planctomycetota bacterium]MDA1140734.1 LapA family protein [Planctomycetota bacterium]
MKKKIKIGIVVVMLILFVTAMIQNLESVKVTFLAWSPRLPMILVLLISVIVGFIGGILYPTIRARRKR